MTPLPHRSLAFSSSTEAHQRAAHRDVGFHAGTNVDGARHRRVQELGGGRGSVGSGRLVGDSPGGESSPLSLGQLRISGSGGVAGVAGVAGGGTASGDGNAPGSSAGAANTGIGSTRSYGEFRRQAKAFRAWVAGVRVQHAEAEQAQAVRRKQFMATNFYRHQLLGRCFLRWTAAVLRRRRKVADMAALHSFRFQQIHFEAWRDTAHEVREEKAAVKKALAFWERSTSRRVLLAMRRCVLGWLGCSVL